MALTPAMQNALRFRKLLCCTLSSPLRLQDALPGQFLTPYCNLLYHNCCKPVDQFTIHPLSEDFLPPDWKHLTQSFPAAIRG